MSHQLATCLIAVAANLAGMLVIYSALSQAIARLAWRDRGVLGVVLLILFAQFFWIAPALAIVGDRSSASYALWFGNWLVCGFSVVLFWKSATRIPLALDDAARLDGLGAFDSWRHTILPFVRRDLAVVATFTVMATLLPFWSFIYLPEASNVVTIFERTASLGEHIGMMVAASLVSALPLIAIFFAVKRRA
jgi:multiple sugar transport system permease protein